MSKRQDALIAEQQTYIDMVTAREPYRAVTASDRMLAQRELAALRAERDALLARVAELEASVKEWREQTMWTQDILDSELEAERSEAQNGIPHGLDQVLHFHRQECHDPECSADADALAELSALQALSGEARTLRPVKCRPECWRKGWDAAIEAAANCAEECELSHDASGGALWSEQVERRQETAEAIRAIVPPADCGGQCNPLAPDVLVDKLADALNDLKARMGVEAWNEFVEMSHK